MRKTIIVHVNSELTLGVGYLQWVYRVGTQVPVYSLYMWQASGGPAQA